MPAQRVLVDVAAGSMTPASTWTKTRNWTAALLALEIHFEDRLPD